MGQIRAPINKIIWKEAAFAATTTYLSLRKRKKKREKKVKKWGLKRKQLSTAKLEEYTESELVLV